MSKIGKISISIPEKVKAVLSGSVLNIEGPLGKKSLNIDLEMFNLDVTEGKEISISPKVKDQNSKRLWGMNRSLINNAVIGSSTGYEKILELVGVGYRAALKDKVLNIEKINPEFITTGNIGGITQISNGTKIPILHTVEIIDWYTGGPKPESLKD